MQQLVHRSDRVPCSSIREHFQLHVRTMINLLDRNHCCKNSILTRVALLTYIQYIYKSNATISERLRSSNLRFVYWLFLAFLILLSFSFIPSDCSRYNLPLFSIRPELTLHYCVVTFFAIHVWEHYLIWRIRTRNTLVAYVIMFSVKITRKYLFIN